MLFVFQESIAQTNVSGKVSGTWKTGSSYQIMGDIIIPDDSTLIIQEGVEVAFFGSFRFIVDGLLQAIGTAKNKITFRRHINAGPWKNIYFSPDANPGCILTYCILKDGGSDDTGAIRIVNNESNVTISNCEILNSSSHGIFVQTELVTNGGDNITVRCKPTIINNSIHSNASDGIYSQSIFTNTLISAQANNNTCIASPLIRNNIIFSNRRNGIRCYTLANGGQQGDFNLTIQANPMILQNTIYGHLLNGIQCSTQRTGFPDGTIEANPYISSNIISSCGEYGLNANNTVSTNNLRHNDFWKNTRSNFSGISGGIGKNNRTNSNGDSCDINFNILFDPKFVAAEKNDFYLMGISKCINAGDLTLPWDEDGSYPDIGAISAYTLKASFESDSTRGTVPLTVRFKSTSTQGANPIQSYFWDFGDKKTSTEQNPIHTYDSAGQFTVSLIISDGTSADTTTKTNFITVSNVSGVNENPTGIPKSYTLSQNHPNPFNPETVIDYQLPIMSNVELIIYNALGQKMRTLISTHQNVGHYNIKWDGTNDAGNQAPSGLYLYQMKAGNFSQTKKMLLIR
jgi:PKD repeat protein